MSGIVLGKKFCPKCNRAVGVVRPDNEVVYAKHRISRGKKSDHTYCPNSRREVKL